MGSFQICSRPSKWCLIRSSNASVHLKIRPPDISSEIHIFHFILWKMSHSTTKPNKSHMRPAKTNEHSPSLITETLLSAWRNLGSLAIHWGDSEDSDLTGQMPSVIWFFDGHTGYFVLFCHVAAYIMTKIGISSIIIWRHVWECNKAMH